MLVIQEMALLLLKQVIAPKPYKFTTSMICWMPFLDFDFDDDEPFHDTSPDGSAQSMY